MYRRQKVTVYVDRGLLPYDRDRGRSAAPTGNLVLCSVAPVPELGATPSTASVSACGSTGVAGRVDLTPAAAETTMRKIAASPVRPALTRCAVNDRVVRAMRDCVSTGPRCFTTAQERRTLRSPKRDPYVLMLQLHTLRRPVCRGIQPWRRRKIPRGAPFGII